MLITTFFISVSDFSISIIPSKKQLYFYSNQLIITVLSCVYTIYGMKESELSEL